MLKCPECETNYPHGTIVCLNDGHEFVQNEQSRQLVLAISRGMIVAPALVMKIEHVDGINFEDSAPKIVITHTCLRLHPIRIGRRDYRSNPPIFPEIDFHNFFVNSPQPPSVSRLHAVIEMRDKDICLRPVSLRPTFVYQTEETGAVALTADQYHTLAHNDIIYLSYPTRRHIRLRVLMA